MERVLRRLKAAGTRSAGSGVASVDVAGRVALHLQIVDAAGHLVAHRWLSRYHFGHPSGTATRSRIEYHVKVDPSVLRERVDAFEAMGAA